jgi:hypothetical protein
MLEKVQDVNAAQKNHPSHSTAGHDQASKTYKCLISLNFA